MDNYLFEIPGIQMEHVPPILFNYYHVIFADGIKAHITV